MCTRCNMGRFCMYRLRSRLHVPAPHSSSEGAARSTTDNGAEVARACSNCLQGLASQQNAVDLASGIGDYAGAGHTCRHRTLVQELPCMQKGPPSFRKATPSWFKKTLNARKLRRSGPERREPQQQRSWRWCTDRRRRQRPRWPSGKGPCGRARCRPASGRA